MIVTFWYIVADTYIIWILIYTPLYIGCEHSSFYAWLHVCTFTICMLNYRTASSCNVCAQLKVLEVQFGLNILFFHALHPFP